MVVCFLLLLFEFPLEFSELTVDVISLQLSLLLSGVLSVSCSCWELTHCLFVLDINSFFPLFQNSSFCLLYFLFLLSLLLNCVRRCSALMTSAGLSQFLDLCRTIALATSLFFSTPV